MTLQLINSHAVDLPFPEWSCSTIITEPYCQGYHHFAEVFSDLSDPASPNCLQRFVHVITGILLWLPIVNIVIYVALRALSGCGSAYQDIPDAVSEQPEVEEKEKSDHLPIDPIQTEEPVDEVTDLSKIEEPTTEAQIAWAKAVTTTISNLRTTAFVTSTRNDLIELIEQGEKEGFLHLRITGAAGNRKALLTAVVMVLDDNDLVKNLINRRGIDLKAKTECTHQNTALAWALANANNVSAMAILKYAASHDYLNCKSRNGNTALHLAVGKGYTDKSRDGKILTISSLELIHKLISLGCNVNISNQKGNTPLHLACMRRSIPMIQALLQAGANPNIRNAQGETPQEMLDFGYEKASQHLKTSVWVYLLEKNEYNASLEQAQTIFSTHNHT